MSRLFACALAFALVAPVGASVSAQSPARAVAQTAATIPSTPAGEALRSWLDAFDSADSTRIDAYVRRYQPDRGVDDLRRFSAQTGGFDLLTIERSEPRHIEFTVKEHNSATTAYGIIEVADAAPNRVTSFPLWALGDNASASAIHIDAATRAHVVATTAALLDSFYVFPDVARRMGDTLRARLARGAYDAETNGIAFALRLHNDLRDIAHDKHLRVDYRVRAMPAQPSGPEPAPTPDVLARERQQMDEINCGFDRVERLEGNVGYLKFDMFADPELCASTASAAMNFLAGTRALVVDLRENGGGSPAMVAYVASYLFDARTHLNDLWERRTGKTEEFWTRDSVPGRRFGGEKPVYVLTSARTFSGAEEFTYDLKSLQRATVVGETTGGGAHPVAGHRIDDHFVIGVPFARAINPTTHTNWEGVGVAPDVKVPAGDALTTALRLIREKARQ